MLWPLHLHEEIKASTSGLILTILLINTDVGWWVVGSGVAIFSCSLSFLLSSQSTCLSNLSFLYFVFFFLSPLSVSLQVSRCLSISPSLCTFFILSCVSLDQTGEAFYALPFYLFHICNCQKEDCYFRSCLCLLVLMESQIEEVVLKAS